MFLLLKYGGYKLVLYFVILQNICLKSKHNLQIYAKDCTIKLYYSKGVKGQRKLFDHFCKYVFTCVNIFLRVHDLFSSG